MVRLIRKGIPRWGEREIIYLSLNCHHENDFCIKMGSDESHFNVSVGSDGQSHKTVVHKPQPFWGERRAEALWNRSPSAYQPNALPPIPVPNKPSRFCGRKAKCTRTLVSVDVKHHVYLLTVLLYRSSLRCLILLTLNSSYSVLNMIATPLECEQ